MFSEDLGSVCFIWLLMITSHGDNVDYAFFGTVCTSCWLCCFRHVESCPDSTRRVRFESRRVFTSMLFIEVLRTSHEDSLSSTAVTAT